MNSKNMTGKNMNGKTKFLILGLLLLVALSFFLGHFWSCAIFALQKAVAGTVPSFFISQFLAGIIPVHFLL